MDLAGIKSHVELKGYHEHGTYDWLIFEVERLNALAGGRLETIKDMSAYLDDVAMALNVPKPATPGEGVGACWKVMEAIGGLNLQNSKLRAIIREADGYLDTNKFTNIAHGCFLHQEFKRVLEKLPAEVELWCVHIEGPDDILAMPTKDFAERVALNLNKGFDELKGDDIHILAAVVPYPWSKEGFDKAMDTWADMVAEDWG